MVHCMWSLWISKYTHTHASSHLFTLTAMSTFCQRSLAVPFFPAFIPTYLCQKQSKARVKLEVRGPNVACQIFSCGPQELWRGRICFNPTVKTLQPITKKSVFVRSNSERGNSAAATWSAVQAATSWSLHVTIARSSDNSESVFEERTCNFFYLSIVCKSRIMINRIDCIIKKVI